MSEDHPSREALERYVRGELAREERRELERHLAGCIPCQGAVDEIPAAPAGVVRWQGHRFTARAREPEPPVDETREARMQGMKTLLRGMGHLIGRMSELALDELLREPEHGRRMRIRGEEKFQSLVVCELLQARCRQAWLEQPEEAVEHAKLAVAVAERLDRALYGHGPVGDAKALAWMHLGNSFRLASQAPQEGTEGAGPEAFAGEVEAALREVRDACLDREMGFDAALASLDLAAVYLALGRDAEVGRLAAEEAALLQQRGAHPFGVEALRFLRDTAESGGLTPRFLRELSRFVQRSRNNPEMRSGERR